MVWKRLLLSNTAILGMLNFRGSNSFYAGQCQFIIRRGIPITTKKFQVPNLQEVKPCPNGMPCTRHLDPAYSSYWYFHPMDTISMGLLAGILSSGQNRPTVVNLEIRWFVRVPVRFLRENSSWFIISVARELMAFFWHPAILRDSEHQFRHTNSGSNDSPKRRIQCYQICDLKMP